ncbi:MAG: hypothetical protein IJH12_08240 [Clostridia bacterium]|nr:hypothetical protein [Clostridia bacterium]
MNNYLDTLNDEIKEYFSILSPEFPEWMNDYINTPELQRIHKISMSCGTDYTKIFNVRYWYSNLDHSIGVALIVWNFTKDKKQTLSGLFHDIATPTFKHCIDFMNGDSEHQESTEERTEQIIRNSKEIMALLNRDNINVEEVSDYHIYPIADNDTPQLSADRFEYNFSSGLVLHRVWDLDSIREIYNNVTILKNENGIVELGFKDPAICEKYINVVSNLWPTWICDEDRTVMQFIADIVKSMNVKGFISIDDLYEKSEKEIIDKILNCKDSYISDAFKKFQVSSTIKTSNQPFTDTYCTSVKTKKRFVNPLALQGETPRRIYDISDSAKTNIDKYHEMFDSKLSKYIGLDFDFKPYEI